MNKERPYEFVPLYGLSIMIQEYEKLVKEGNFKVQQDLDEMNKEFYYRFEINRSDKQISIDEYMRSRKNESN